ncbi:MAG: lipopolysaccharide biosynthesis protein, partial [Nitrospinales bacterium]
LFRRFIVNISWNVLGKICAQIIFFAVSILLTRYLGKERLGLYATILVIPAFVRLLNSLGLETALNKNFPKFEVLDPTGGQGRYLLKRLLALRALSTAAFCLFLYFLLPFYLDLIRMPELIAYRPAIILYFISITFNSLLSTLFMTLLRYKVTSILETANGILNLVLLVAFIELDWGISAVLYAYIISTGIIVGVYFYLAAPYVSGPEQKMEKDDTFRLARVSYVVGLFSFGLMTQSDIVLMNYFAVDTVRVGYYHLAMGIAGMLGFLLTGIGPMALSIFSETFTNKSYAGLSRVWSQIAGFTVFCTAPIYLFALFNAKTLIVFIYGDQFLDAATALSIYLIFVLLSSAMGAGFSSSTLYVIERRDVPLRATIEGGILNIALNLILIPRYQELGAAAATGLIMVYMAFRQLYYINKYLDIRAMLPLVGKYIFLALAALAPAELIAHMWVNNLFLNLAVYVVAFLGLLAWVKPVSRDQSKLALDAFPFLEPGLKYFVR